MNFSIFFFVVVVDDVLLYTEGVSCSNCLIDTAIRCIMGRSHKLLQQLSMIIPYNYTIRNDYLNHTSKNLQHII